MSKYSPMFFYNLDYHKITKSIIMLTYSELTDLCSKRGISLTELAESAKMTLRGFRDAVNNNSLSARTIIPICVKLGITPNDLLMWDKNISTYNINQVGVVNSQQIGTTGIELLQQQLAIKDEQIGQLHEQINKLLNLLNK